MHQEIRDTLEDLTGIDKKWSESDGGLQQLSDRIDVERRELIIHLPMFRQGLDVSLDVGQSRAAQGDYFRRIRAEPSEV